MRRTFIRGLLICLVPCLAAAYYAAFGQYKLGIDLAGGTILVYEINQERSQERQRTQAGRDGGPAPARRSGLDADEMQRLAAAIKRRIDPADLKNVTVRPLGDNRVEIILPTSGASRGDKQNLTSAEIDQVKELISQVGVLEFRILANEADDGPGIKEAVQLVNGPDAAPALLEAARRGRPPEAPAGEFEVAAAGQPEKVRYSWVELSPEERESLGLSNANEDEKGAAGQEWQRAAQNRDKAYVRSTGSGGKASTMVLYSRKANPESPGALADAAELAKPADKRNPKFLGERKYEYFVLTRVSPFDNLRVGGDVTMVANATTDKSLNPAIGFNFNGAGALQFGRMTERNKPTGGKDSGVIRHLAVILDEKVVSAPTLNSALGAQGIIQGGEKGLRQDYVNRIVTILRSGALTAELRDKPVSENTIGPTLGADTIRRGKVAIGLAFAAVLAFMLVYYRFAGVVACVALFANLLLTVGFMVAVNAAFTLPGLAGIVLMLGMAVDANVLIYERLREERNKGANLVTSIRNGYGHAFPTIIDTHLSSIFTAVVLYTFGNDNLKGFSISLTVGLLISLFTSLFMTRLMFDFWLRQGWLTKLKMMRLFEKPRIDFMGIRHVMFAITGGLTVLGLALFLVRGEKGLNVDFTKGTAYGGSLRDGEERALTKTDDGKLGLRDMLDGDHQDKRLAVAGARWVNRPSIDGDLRALKGAVNEYIYEIKYADGKTATVSLASPPDGDDEAAMERDVVARASHLPDASVEQLFLQGESYGEGKSKYFTVRTTEKEPELVQVSLDRLLREDDGKPLLPVPTMTVPPVTGTKVDLAFTERTSPSYVKALLDRAFRLARADAETGGVSFELTGKKSTDPAEQAAEEREGRFKVMTLDVGKNPKFAALLAREKAASEAKAGDARRTELAARRAVVVAAAPLLGGIAVAVAPEEAAAPAPAGDAAAAAAEAKLLTDDVLAKTKASLESRPVPERLETFDSQLAAETRTKAFYAIVASWAAILLYLWFRFGNWTFGLAAVICLIHDLCFTLGCIAACHYLYDTTPGRLLGLSDFKIDLPTVAALLTLVGYSVNDTIVVFDRIREVRGKNPTLTAQMINDSINQTLSRTVLASLTVFLVVGVLYAFGGEGIHLFAFVMVVGVIVGTYSSIYVASPLLLIFGEGTPTAPVRAPTKAVESVA